jgi:hypothetical protein
LVTMGRTSVLLPQVAGTARLADVNDTSAALRMRSFAVVRCGRV